MQAQIENDADAAADRRRMWNLRTPDELAAHALELSAEEHLVEGLIQRRSITLIVGDSGLGKSPLLYQLAMSVAEGIPFLGRKTIKGKVLFADYENGLVTVQGVIDQQVRFLRLSKRPSNLLLFNSNDTPTGWGEGNMTLETMIRDQKPDLVIIDPITAHNPGVEEKNSAASAMYQDIRNKLIKTVGCAVVFVHHIKKVNDDPAKRPPSLDDLDSSREWFLQARGARALINGVDVRIAVDLPGISSMRPGKTDEIALVVGGFERVRGELPKLYLARVFDDEGDPMGYRVVADEEFLSPEYREAFRKLPDAFRNRDAKAALGKGDQSTSIFLKRLVAQGLLIKDGPLYRKRPSTGVNQ
jgi:hypothetical protein